MYYAFTLNDLMYRLPVGQYVSIQDSVNTTLIGNYKEERMLPIFEGTISDLLKMDEILNKYSGRFVGVILTESMRRTDSIRTDSIQRAKYNFTKCIYITLS
jgi:hypothetical protein